MIQFRRVFETKGIYDGLKVAKDPGDYAVTETKIGELYFKTRYFSKKGMYKGMYININTPIELYPHGIRYVDLEVDICSWPEGRVKKLDEKMLKEAAAEGIVTTKILRTAKEKFEKSSCFLTSLIDACDTNLKVFTDMKRRIQQFKI